MAGSVRRRGKNSWEVSFERGKDPITGKRRMHSENIKGRRKDADRKLTELLHERDTGTDLTPHRLTVASYLQRWLRDDPKHTVAQSTFVCYASIVDRHLIPKLGSLRLADLRPAHIQAAYGSWLDSGPSRQTVQQHHAVLRKSLVQAVKWRLLGRNPVDAVSPPKPIRKALRVLDASEVANLVANAGTQQLQLLLQLAVETGMRQGELIALRWREVDVEMATIQVVRSARRYKEIGVVVDVTKTHRSNRPVSISHDTAAQLSNHRKRQLEHRLATDAEYEGNDLVFANDIGAFLPIRTS